MVGEITMICMDNSKWMTDDNLITWFINQSEAIEFYCERKLQAHPDNKVGIIRMGELDHGVQLMPTDDFQDVKRALGGFLASVEQHTNLLEGLILCKYGWLDNEHMDKRIVVFSGGPLSFADKDLEALAKLLLKEDTSVVVDVVDIFPVVEECKAQKLQKLVTYMIYEQNQDKNKVGTYFRVQAEADGRSISDHQSTSSILPPLVAEGGSSSRKKKQKKRPFRLVAEIGKKKQKKHRVLLARPVIANSKW